MLDFDENEMSVYKKGSLFQKKSMKINKPTLLYTIGATFYGSNDSIILSQFNTIKELPKEISEMLTKK